jgi:serine/threonine-protein kinase
MPASLTDALRDRYIIDRELGRGGMATVYLAKDVKHGREVALKVLRPELAVALGGGRFLQEIRITARLDHPHILTLIDSGETDGYLWYVLPYVRGESLRAKLNREKQLTQDEALRIAAQVAGALDYAHRQGIVHRDIKPENILLHEGEAVVADFGIALALREAGGERITETGLSLGTPQYMSPEQATGDRELDARSDVYSLAAVVYEMFAGEPPYTGPTVQAVIAKLMTEPPPRLRAVRGTVSDSVDATLRKALAKVPADRFPGTAEFVAALTGPGKPVDHSRRKLGIAAATLVVLAIAIGTGFALTRRGKADPAAVVEASPSVAVLPFANLSGDPKDDYLSDGMTEELIGQLAQVRELKVISRTSTDALKGTRLSLREIADTLGVRHIVEGSVRRAENRIRVTVDLIDATTDSHVWSTRYDRDLTDVFAVQSEIAQHVADSLVTAVGAHSLVGEVTVSRNPEAYAAYLAGRTMVYRRSIDGLRGAMEQFRRAIALDSTYAPAYAGLAAVSFLWGAYRYQGLDMYDTYRKGLAAAERAIALDPAHADGYAARGMLRERSQGSQESIAADYARALELSPNSANIHQWHSQFLFRYDQLDAAYQEAERAVALDPLAPGVRVTMMIQALGARRYDVVRAQGERILALEPSIVRAQATMALADLLSGDASRCLGRDLGIYASLRALCLFSAGRTEEARQLVDSVIAAVRNGTAGNATFSPAIALQGLAEYYAWTGDAAKALEWLGRVYDVNPDGEDVETLRSGLYDKVSSDPGFKAGLERIRGRVRERVLGAN